MTNSRQIAADALFMILYIGLAAGMACLTLTLMMFLLLELPLAPGHAVAAAVNLAGWLALPFFPRLYRWIVGHRFSWRENTVLGTSTET